MAGTPLANSPSGHSISKLPLNLVVQPVDMLFVDFINERVPAALKVTLGISIISAFIIEPLFSSKVLPLLPHLKDGIAIKVPFSTPPANIPLFIMIVPLVPPNSKEFWA